MLGGQGLLFLNLVVLHRPSHQKAIQTFSTMTKARSYRGADVDPVTTAWHPRIVRNSTRR